MENTKRSKKNGLKVRGKGPLHFLVQGQKKKIPLFLKPAKEGWGGQLPLPTYGRVSPI